MTEFCIFGVYFPLFFPPGTRKESSRASEERTGTQTGSRWW